MKRFVLILVLCVITSMTALAKSFFMITSTVTKNHLKFKQTSDNTWLMYVPATYPCHMSRGTVGFKFMVSDEEGYLYMPVASGSTEINGDAGFNTGSLVKSTSKRSTNVYAQLSDNWLEVKKGGASQVSKAEDIVMDGCLVFEITLGADGNLTYKATLDPTRRVSYAACNTTEGEDNGTYYPAANTTFLFASKLPDGTFSPYYKGKVVVEKLASENNDHTTHNGFGFYTPVIEASQNKYEGDGNDWWKQVGNALVNRGISDDGQNLYASGTNYSVSLTGSYDISTTFYYGKSNQGKMEKKVDDAYDDPLVGCIRTYCNEEKNMESRYNVKVFLVTGYNKDRDAFIVTEIPYIPKGVGVLLYTTDATVDVLKPEKEWTGETISNIEETYGKNYLVPTFTPTQVSTFSTMNGKKYINFFLAKLFSAKDYEQYKDKYGTNNYWGFFSVLNTQTSKANRAYLQYPYDDNFDGFSHFPERNDARGAKLALGLFDDDNITTGIKNVPEKQDSKVDNQYYTLDGRKVEKPTHGLFIHNGKTYLFK